MGEREIEKRKGFSDISVGEKGVGAEESNQGAFRIGADTRVISFGHCTVQHGCIVLFVYKPQCSGSVTFWYGYGYADLYL
jgi:hypothetical protein